jgi:hypothetical protein
MGLAQKAEHRDTDSKKADGNYDGVDIGALVALYLRVAMRAAKLKRELRRARALRSSSLKLRRASGGTRLEVDWRKNPNAGATIPRWQ